MQQNRKWRVSNQTNKSETDEKIKDKKHERNFLPAMKICQHRRRESARHGADTPTSFHKFQHGMIMNVCLNRSQAQVMWCAPICFHISIFYFNGGGGVFWVVKLSHCVSVENLLEMTGWVMYRWEQRGTALVRRTWAGAARPSVLWIGVQFSFNA